MPPSRTENGGSSTSTAAMRPLTSSSVSSCSSSFPSAPVRNGVRHRLTSGRCSSAARRFTRSLAPAVP